METPLAKTLKEKKQSNQKIVCCCKVDYVTVHPNQSLQYLPNGKYFKNILRFEQCSFSLLFKFWAMGTAERKVKEKEELTALILEAARKLFVEKGIEQTTIRNIAESIDYSIGTVYVYFKDKNAILHALHSQCFADLSQQFTVLFSVKDPMERLKALGRVYIKYALDHYDMYDLMFNMKAPIEFLESMNKEEWNEGQEAFEVLKTTVKECISAGHFKGHKLEPLAFLIWSIVHGMCSLEIRERTKWVKLKNPDTIVTEGYEEFIKILEKL